MKKINPLIFAILAISLFLRFNTLPHLMSFTPDEAYQAYITQTLIKSFHIIWIGLSAGAYNLYLGPLWNYIIYPFLSFSHGDPISLGYLASALGVFATYLIYEVGKRIFNQNTGIIASLLYAISPLLVYYDQKPYPSGVTLLSLLILFSLYMTKYKGIWFVLFAASFALVFHIHLSLLPVVFVAIYIALRKRQQITLKNFLLSAIVFLTLVSPLIVFDYFHNWSNISAPFTVLKADKTKLVKMNLNLHTDSLFDSLGRLLYLKPYQNNSDEILYPCTLVSNSTRSKAPFLISALVSIILIYFLIRKKTWQNYGKKLIALLSISILIPFIFFQFINPIEYYLLGLYPLLILIISSTVESLKPRPKTISYVMIAIITMFGIFTVITAKGDYGLTTKKILISKIMNTIGTSSYSLSEEGDCHKYEAWRYLFATYARIPNQSSEDPIFGWLYKKELTSIPAKYSIIIKETRSLKPVPSEFKYSFQEGGFTAYIYEN